MNNIDIDHFYSLYQEKLEDPIMRNFLKDSDNYGLFLNAMEKPTNDNKQLLDKAFKSYFKKVKIISYISNLIYFYSIGFDKKVSINNKRNILNLDKPITNEGENHTTILDLMSDDLTDITYMQFEKKQTHLKEHITDELLYEGLSLLSKKQLEILNLYYVHQYNNKQISRILSVSEQTISYNHKKALKTLKSQLIGGK
ncbi:sigma-70 family RNA polymerase sigma factor [Bacillus tropicus]|uniref:Sigma-70 family RNA polymerase sigma factor n=1 Tax=Bacillus tropicus TaxID=2026188 RepID=A0A5C5A4Z4_9BACI|nr:MULTISPECIES: sigma-70 family RNA polymerase sigma factor [Bacillus]AIY76694.1 RNA polymerase sigma factor, sigma-70 family protein [Bacillus cereus]AJI04073.1 RNA polymerase sigma factor, sigma-70 family protein [Bacillus cereus G9241]ALL22533.1 RNA polymerase subunit sigma-70 [Bacillus thuringiensis]AJG93195.1 RNA polymerase sigma factor, sigma-70 family protein [Bacillus cereus]KDB41339.1 RNA polymerase sigma70 [Bacillus cereus]